jgi:hypothetical protein
MDFTPPNFDGFDADRSDPDRSDASSDPFGPPAISTLVHCIHCGEEYDSYRIEWRQEQRSDGRTHGFWCCPMPGCDGAGFGIDIFPVDPDYRDEDGELMWVDDDDDEDDDEDEDDDDEDDDEFDDDFDADFEEEMLSEDDAWIPDEEIPFGKFRHPDDDLPF